MWLNNQTIAATYATPATTAAWANIAGTGWRRIRPSTPDGVTNLHLMMSIARANNRQVHVYIGAASNMIERAYLL